MKKQNNKILKIAGSFILCFMVLYACKKSFLERPPIGQISSETLNNKAGVNGLLIGAYSMLDGEGINDWMIGTANTTVWMPWVGTVASDEAHKGGGFGSQGERAEVENYKYNSQNPILHDRWRFYYGAIQRTNEAIRGLDKVPEGEFTPENALQVRAEARFLRGVYHFLAAQMFRNIPYIDESITFSAQNYKVSNMPAGSAWPKIEGDFQYAIDNLTPTKQEVGRANKWAAKAFLAKVYMQQNKLAEAKPLLEDLINNGVTSSGTKYALEPKFSNLFRGTHRNGPEGVFQVQMSVNDGGEGRNGNEGMAFNYPAQVGTSPGWGGWGVQPSFNLVNSYKTKNGLPMLDDFNNVDLKNNMTLAPSESFTPSTEPVDPRLDRTVGRRGIPYLDWGLYNLAPNPQGGPFSGIKWVYSKTDASTGSEVIDGWQYASSINYNMIRFADILLWDAECEVELGSLQRAEDLVNMVRARAANSDDFVKKYVDDSDPSKGFSNTPAANYDISLYGGSNGFVTKGKDYARKAVRFERKLELATEGGRFFDLQRYDLAQPGYMADLLNKNIHDELAKFNSYLVPPATYSIYVGAVFVKGVNEIYAIPQAQIDQSAQTSGPTLIQNPGH
ncbi:MAG: RagB/SusD family nutrient uptake outer membrane protein [Ginsengibacter sp.]